MTFIDGQTQPPNIFQIVLFSILSASFVVCGLWVFYRSHTRRHYARVYVVRFLFPIACFFCATENLYLSSSNYFIAYSLDSLQQHPMLVALFVLQAMQVPIFLVTIFELTYLIHKRRSVHFLGMYFDEGRLGRRVKGVFSTPCKSFLARNLIRMLSTLLFATGIVVNFDVVEFRNVNTVGDLTGKTGWWQLFDEENPFEPAIVMSLIPIAVLVVCSFVLSTTLWRWVRDFEVEISFFLSYFFLILW